MSLEMFYRFFKEVDIEKQTLFAFTGDIDNLGLYVAENGRAKAECLVDDYNLIIEKELKAFCKEKHIHILLSLSGEEVFGICAADNKLMVTEFADFLKTKINSCLKKRSEYFRNDVTISFGVVLVNDERLKDITNIKISKRYTKNEMNILKELIYNIRIDLTVSLDEAKFSTLSHSSKKSLVFYRNIVYAKMMQYKRETRNILINLSSLENFSELSEKYGDSYGITEEEYFALTNLIKGLGK